MGCSGSPSEVTGGRMCLLNSETFDSSAPCRLTRSPPHDFLTLAGVFWPSISAARLLLRFTPAGKIFGLCQMPPSLGVCWQACDYFGDSEQSLLQTLSLIKPQKAACPGGVFLSR